MTDDVYAKLRIHAYVDDRYAGHVFQYLVLPSFGAPVAWDVFRRRREGYDDDHVLVRTSMLIRPDGCIAWAGDVGDVEGLVDALERWFASAAPRPGGFQERSCSAGPSSSTPSRSEQRR
ncbi:hypothetical protein [Sorangium sp. So ce131]|uniref:aromatic-ring hydroxylase C-terminal domain-containing protein n=1 Tax=Sorangium sp. So ce131 TaxID=3133282 RepID=UPI003F6119FF